MTSLGKSGLKLFWNIGNKGNKVIFFDGNLIKTIILCLVGTLFVALILDDNESFRCHPTSERKHTPIYRL